MILVDTSVWVDHFHHSDPELEDLLRQRLILVHPFVIGELALGSFPKRAALLDSLHALRRAMLAHDSEVLRLIDAWELAGTGIGYIDAHLLASTLLTPETLLWTRDRKLRTVARQLSLDAK